MPPTIVGRCQRFDFRRVGGEALAAHLLDVAGREGLKLEPEAETAILGGNALRLLRREVSAA